MVVPLMLNFRVFNVKLVGVPKFRNFTVCFRYGNSFPVPLNSQKTFL